MERCPWQIPHFVEMCINIEFLQRKKKYTHTSVYMDSKDFKEHKPNVSSCYF